MITQARLGIVSLMACLIFLIIFLNSASAGEDDYIWEFKIPVELSHMMKKAEFATVRVKIYQGDKLIADKLVVSSAIKNDGSLDETLTLRFYDDDMLYDGMPGLATNYVASISGVSWKHEYSSGGIATNDEGSGPDWGQAMPGSKLKGTGLMNQGKGILSEPKITNPDFKFDGKMPPQL